MPPKPPDAADVLRDGLSKAFGKWWEEGGKVDRQRNQPEYDAAKQGIR